MRTCRASKFSPANLSLIPFMQRLSEVKPLLLSPLLQSFSVEVNIGFGIAHWCKGRTLGFELQVWVGFHPVELFPRTEVKFQQGALHLSQRCIASSKLNSLLTAAFLTIKTTPKTQVIVSHKSQNPF